MIKARKWFDVSDNSNGTYETGKLIKFNTIMLKSNQISVAIMTTTYL